MLNSVAKLTNVARPGVAFQAGDHSTTETSRCGLASGALLLQEVGSQKGDVFTPLAERGDPQDAGIEASKPGRNVHLGRAAVAIQTRLRMLAMQKYHTS
jgi:hypothetical protein